MRGPRRVCKPAPARVTFEDKQELVVVRLGTVDEMLQRLVLAARARSRSTSEAARWLGITRKTLTDWLCQYRLAGPPIVPIEPPPPPANFRELEELALVEGWFAYPKAFGAYVRAMRKSCGMTQEALAEKLGLHPISLGAVERGRNAGPESRRILSAWLQAVTELREQRNERAAQWAGTEEQRNTGAQERDNAGTVVHLHGVVGRRVAWLPAFDVPSQEQKNIRTREHGNAGTPEQAGLIPREENMKRQKRPPVRIGVVSQKGGSGKSTLVRGLAGWLLKKGRKVLLVDGDHAQYTTAGWYGARAAMLSEDSMRAEASRFEVCEAEHPGTIEIKIPDGPEGAALVNAPEVVLYDLPGRLDREVRQVLLQIDVAVVPLRASYDDLRAFDATRQQIVAANGVRERPLRTYVVLNGLTRETQVLKKIAGELPAQLPEHFELLPGVALRQSSDWSHANAVGLFPHEYKPNGLAATDIDAVGSLLWKKIAHG